MVKYTTNDIINGLFVKCVGEHLAEYDPLMKQLNTSKWILKVSGQEHTIGFEHSKDHTSIIVKRADKIIKLFDGDTGVDAVAEFLLPTEKS